MAQPQGNQDYLDKAFNAGAKKFGGAQGQKVAGNRALSEKIVRYLPFSFYYPSYSFLSQLVLVVGEGFMAYTTC